MAMLSKGKSKPTTVDEYLATVSPDKRAALERLRASIHAVIPTAEECISYGMPAFRLDGKAVAWFAAAAKHCSFYPGGIVNDFKDQLAKYETSKGTIRFRPDQSIPQSLIRKLIRGQLERRAQVAGGTRRATGSGKKLNAKWHSAHPMPKPATLAQRIAWHRAHARHCACREIPKSLRPYFEDTNSRP